MTARKNTPIGNSMGHAVIQAANQVMAVEAENSRPRALVEYANDPVGFFINVLGDRPWRGDEHGITGQMEWLEGLPENRYNLLFAGTGVGKTWLIARTCLWFVSTREDAIFVTVATTWEQVVRQLWREIADAHRKALIPLPGKVLNHSLEIGEKWYGIGLSPRNPESLAGYHAKITVRREVQLARARWREMSNAEYFGVGKDGAGPTGGALMLAIDEASGVMDELHDAGDGITTGPRCYVIKSGNLVRTSGRFHEHWTKNKTNEPNRLCYADEEPAVAEAQKDALAQTAARANETAIITGDQADAGSVWRAVRWTAFDAPPAIVDREFVDRMRRDCGRNYMQNPRYMVRVLAMPPLGSDLCIFPQGLLEDCADIVPGIGGRHMGVDLGFGGGDPCVATLIVNGRVSSVFVWHVTGPKLDEFDSARVIFHLATGCENALDAMKPDRPDLGWNVPMRNIHVDATGNGLAVVNALRRFFQFYVDGVNLGSGVQNDWSDVIGPSPDRLLNRRHELHWIAMRLMQEGLLAIPDRPEYSPIWADLSSIRLADKGLDKFAVEDKRAFIKREGRSPDFGDSVLLACSRVDPTRIRFATVPRRVGLNGRRPPPRGYLGA